MTGFRHKSGVLIDFRGAGSAIWAGELWRVWRVLREAAFSGLVLGYTARPTIHTQHRGVMAIGLLATITVLEGKNGVSSKLLDLTEKVRANEPGSVFYALHKWQRSAGV
ncbi:MAG: hypothetical protein CM15mP103_07950 [Gammaproteobacteria bacterium]|nr:MAG: hypothetical protein CM15mP103_07950 [Gammaproteobacteria bacterium]